MKFKKLNAKNKIEKNKLKKSYKRYVKISNSITLYSESQIKKTPIQKIVIKKLN